MNKLTSTLNLPFKKSSRCDGIGMCMHFYRLCPGLERSCTRRKMQKWTVFLPTLKAILSKGTAHSSFCCLGKGYLSDIINMLYFIC